MPDSAPETVHNILVDYIDSPHDIEAAEARLEALIPTPKPILTMCGAYHPELRMLCDLELNHGPFTHDDETYDHQASGESYTAYWVEWAGVASPSPTHVDTKSPGGARTPTQTIEGTLGTWSHCGSPTAHGPHFHSVIQNEGLHRVECLGTPGTACAHPPEARRQDKFYGRSVAFREICTACGAVLHATPKPDAYTMGDVTDYEARALLAGGTLPVYGPLDELRAEFPNARIQTRTVTPWRDA